jgi:hypothetical protein
VFAQEIAKLVIAKAKALGGGALIVPYIRERAAQQIRLERVDRRAKIIGQFGRKRCRRGRDRRGA